MRPDFRLIMLAAALLLPAQAGHARAKPAAKPAQLSQDGSVNFGLALNYLESGMLDRALVRINRAAASDPKSVDVFTVAALIHARLGHQDKAEEAFAKALKLGPGEGTLNNAYGTWLCEHKTPAEGEPYLRKAMENPGRQPLRNILANASSCAYKARDYAKSEQWLRQLLDVSPEDSGALLQMVRVKLAQGQFFEARAFLQRHEALGQMTAEAYELAVQMETGAGDEKSANRYRALLREAYPDHELPTGEGAGRP